MSGISEHPTSTPVRPTYEDRPISEEVREPTEDVASRDLKIGFGVLGACAVIAVVLGIIFSLV